MAARGFTLIEMVVVVLIVGVLASIAMPLLEVTTQRAREAELRTALRQIRGALDEYKKAADAGRVARPVDASGYPPRLEDLVAGTPDAKHPGNGPIYFLRRIPRDPMFADPSVPAAQTWGLRSYESPPDNPAEGDDVFDVYSLSERVGLNGIPYREW